MVFAHKRDDSIVELAQYRDSDDFADPLLSHNEQESTRLGKGSARSKRGRPWLKYAFFGFLIFFFGVTITSMSSSDVRAKAVEYYHKVRPDSPPQVDDVATHSMDGSVQYTPEQAAPPEDALAQPSTGDPSETHEGETITYLHDDASTDGSAKDDQTETTTDNGSAADGSRPVEEAKAHQDVPSISGGQQSSTESPASTSLETYHSCDDVPAATVAELQQAGEATIRVMSRDKAVSPGDTLAGPVPICVLVAIPQVQLPEDEYTDAPVAGKGPDSIHLLLNSTDVVVTFPPLVPLHGQPDAERLRTEGVIIYKADTILYTAGTYQVTANHDFDHWRWAQEWWREGEGFGTYYTPTGVPAGDLFTSHEWNERPLTPTSITVSGSKEMPSRPPCSDQINAGVGRWYKQASFTSLSETLADEWGYVWDGDHCQLSYFSPMDTVDCFANKNIQFFGDSMTRRIAKTVIAGGEWCRILDHTCQDADDDAKGQVPKVDYLEDTHKLNFTSFPRGRHFQSGDKSPIEFGKNSTAYFSFLTAMTNNSGLWMDRLYEETDLKVLKVWGGPENNETNDRMILPGAFDHARPPPESANGAVDLVVVGFGAWDQAFSNRFDAYENELGQFRDALVKAYSTPKSPQNTPIILRMSNSWCCRNTETHFRRYTGARICEFNDRTKKVFGVEDVSGQALDGRMLTVNPTNMNGRPDIVREFGGSHANHPRASFVRLEMQMLMNSVCARDAQTGAVTLRGT